MWAFQAVIQPKQTHWRWLAHGPPISSIWPPGPRCTKKKPSLHRVLQCQGKIWGGWKRLSARWSFPNGEKQPASALPLSCLQSFAGIISRTMISRKLYEAALCSMNLNYSVKKLILKSFNIKCHYIYIYTRVYMELCVCVCVGVCRKAWALHDSSPFLTAWRSGRSANAAPVHRLLS